MTARMRGRVALITGGGGGIGLETGRLFAEEGAAVESSYVTGATLMVDAGTSSL